MGDPTKSPMTLGGIATTPGTFPGAVLSGPASPLGGGDPGAPPDQMAQLLKIIIAGAQQRPHLEGATSPAPVPPGAPQRETLVGKHTGPANLGNLIGSTIQNAVHMDRQKKLAAATSDWNDLLTSTQKYIKPDGSIDEKAYQDPAVMQILGDPKKLKLMAKSLNQDWLNPKPDLYADARNIALKQHTDKQGALQGLKSVFASMNQRIRGQGQQQPQMTDEQRQAMAKDVMSRAPIAQGATDLKTVMPVITELMKQQTAEKTQASIDKRQEEKEQFQAYQDQYKAGQSQILEGMREQSRTTLARMGETAAALNEDKRLAVMMKGMQMREADEFAIKPSEINKEVSSTLTDLRTQFTQANQQLKQLQAQAQSKGFWKTVGSKIGLVDDPDVAGARWQVDQLQKAIGHIEENRAKIVHGDVDMDQIVNQAMQILNTPPPPQGAVVDRSPKEAP